VEIVVLDVVVDGDHFGIEGLCSDCAERIGFVIIGFVIIMVYFDAPEEVQDIEVGGVVGGLVGGLVGGVVGGVVSGVVGGVVGAGGGAEKASERHEGVYGRGWEESCIVEEEGGVEFLPDLLEYLGAEGKEPVGPGRR